MKDRLKEVRKSHANGKSQYEFASWLGISRDNLASYESGRRVPSDAFISLFCEKCRINEKWLRTGEGQMKIAAGKEQEIAELVARLYGANENSFEYKLAMMLKDLAPDDLERAKKFVKALAESE